MIDIDTNGIDRYPLTRFTATWYQVDYSSGDKISFFFYATLARTRMERAISPTNYSLFHPKETGTNLTQKSSVHTKNGN